MYLWTNLLTTLTPLQVVSGSGITMFAINMSEKVSMLKKTIFLCPNDAAK
jgi:hypothetical protein